MRHDQMSGLGLLGAANRSPVADRVAERLGARDLRNSAHDNWFFAYALNFSAVADGASSTQSIRVDGSVGLLVDQFQGDFWLNAADNGSLAGTPLLRRAYENATGEHTLYPLSKLTVQMQQTDRPWFDRAIPAHLILGDAINPYYLPFKPYVPPNEVVSVTINNNTGATIDGTIALVGFKMAVRGG